MTQPGETGGYDAGDHVNAIYKHVSENFLDYIIVNAGKIDKQLEKKYKSEGSQLVEINHKKLKKLGVGVIEGDFVKIKKDLLGMILKN